MSCKDCDHATDTGSWTQELLNRGGTHCRDCHRSWVSKVEAHCVVCHCHFSTNSTADIHNPYCSPDHDQTLDSLLSARKKDGNPVLALRDRSYGPVLVSWSPESANETSGRPW